MGHQGWVGLPEPRPPSIVLPQRRDVPRCYRREWFQEMESVLRNWMVFKKSHYSFYWAKKKYCFLLVFLAWPFSSSSSLSSQADTPPRPVVPEAVATTQSSLTGTSGEDCNGWCLQLVGDKWMGGRTDGWTQRSRAASVHTNCRSSQFKMRITKKQKAFAPWSAFVLRNPFYFMPAHVGENSVFQLGREAARNLCSLNPFIWLHVTLPTVAGCVIYHLNAIFIVDIFQTTLPAPQEREWGIFGILSALHQVS